MFTAIFHLLTTVVTTTAVNTWDSKHFFPVHFSFTINSHTKWRGFKPNKYWIFEYFAFKSTDLSAFYCLVDTPWFSSSLLSMINCVSLVKDDDEDVVVVIVRLPRQCSLTWVMSSSHTSLTSPMISSIIEYTWYTTEDNLSIIVFFLVFTGNYSLGSYYPSEPGIPRSVCHIQQMVKSVMVIVMGTWMQMTDKKCPYYWILRLHSTISSTTAEKITNKMIHFSVFFTFIIIELFFEEHFIFHTFKHKFFMLLHFFGWILMSMINELED